MKRIILFTILLFSLFTKAQTKLSDEDTQIMKDNERIESRDFPGADASLLLGKQLEVRPKTTGIKKYGYRGFYMFENFDDISMYKRNDRGIYEYDKSCYNSKYESLVGKKFIVESVTPYTNSIRTAKFKLKLKNYSS